MEKSLKVGILRETKDPPERRVPLIPNQIITLKEQYPDVEFFVQPGDNRCYSDEEYDQLNIRLKEDLSDCDILMGVKEVDRNVIIPGKTYLFFSHVTKEQPYNREMFRELSNRKITLIDYENLTTQAGQRVVAFGRWAGIVGAYNGLRAWGIRTGLFDLKPAYQCRDLDELWVCLRQFHINAGLKILVTGEGRVANGALETLKTAKIARAQPDEFLNRNFDVPVFCQIGPEHYTKHRGGLKFSFGHFTEFPGEYDSAFLPYTKVTDIFIAGHYWDPRSPVFITGEDMKKPDFRISVIADISCDINGPIASTVRATSISDPFYGYNPHLETEEPAFSGSSNITVMAVDNLPGEVPRDSSRDFGEQLITNVLHDLLSGNESSMIANATILKKGKLTSSYSYLNNYLNG
jgi:alanine dehydrogenase